MKVLSIIIDRPNNLVLFSILICSFPLFSLHPESTPADWQKVLKEELDEVKTEGLPLLCYVPYVSFSSMQMHYRVPRNIGEVINSTPASELVPFLNILSEKEPKRGWFQCLIRQYMVISDKGAKGLPGEITRCHSGGTRETIPIMSFTLKYTQKAQQ